ncbi:unnamed protein product [Moneuplotes crassus]|uniref:RING-type E3 ubiquitin transferase n=1 Tax=Euplotes crassus TaxID=5936 RepID=A0AAD1U656_EUPCR|nr:unnamed protein product [Moneuplotes crassus]
MDQNKYFGTRGVENREAKYSERAQAFCNIKRKDRTQNLKSMATFDRADNYKSYCDKLYQNSVYQAQERCESKKHIKKLSKNHLSTYNDTKVSARTPSTGQYTSIRGGKKRNPLACIKHYSENAPAQPRLVSKDPSEVDELRCRIEELQSRLVEKDEIINDSNNKLKILQNKIRESESMKDLKKRNEELTLKVEILQKEKEKKNDKIKILQEKLRVRNRSVQRAERSQHISPNATNSHPLDQLNQNTMDNIPVRSNQEEEKNERSAQNTSEGGVQRLIQQTIAPIIERGDALFNNLIGVQERRIIRNQEVNQHLTNLPDLQNYQELLGIERSLIRGTQGGYSNAMIRGIKEIKYIDVHSDESICEAADEVCSICHCNYSNTENIKVLSCSHFYHSGCIEEWLRRNRKCPLCKKVAIPH